MIPLFSKSYLPFLMILILLTSCVSAKKYKGLESEKSKIETTLLSTKQELSDAKRELNKLKDASSSNHETQSETIEGLKQSLEENHAALDAAQVAIADCQNKLQKAENQIKDADKEKQELKSLFEVQKNLTQQNRSLQSIQEDIQTLLTETPTLKMAYSLYKDELILTFDHDYLFSSSTQTISDVGRTALYQLAEVLKKYPSVYIDVNGHIAAGGDSKENWKNSTRKTLSIIYTLTHKEVLPDKIRGIAYGEYLPVADNNTPEGKKQNERSEIILRYQNTQLLKLIPLK